jgi:alanine-synthesizing transaminase
MQEANRLKRLPLYLFTIIDNLKHEAQKKGIDVIDLGMGSPDLPTPKHIVDELCKQAKIEANHRYSRPYGDVELKFKESIAQWYHERFGVSLDPNSEVLPLIGSKEGIANLYLTFLNHDDVVLVPNPAYPVHFNGVVMAGGILYNLPLTEENEFKPDLKSLSKDIIKMSKILTLGYPHNPTTATVDSSFYEDVVEWGKGKDMIIVNDLAYSDIVFDGYKAPSILSVKGAKNMCIEYHTLSKSYSMAGWRLGFVVGNKDILKSIAKTKSYMDFGIFRAVQCAGIQALSGPQDCVKEYVEIYKQRRDLFVEGMNEIGWKVNKPKGTFYIWAHIPMKYSALTSMEFATLLMKEAGVSVAPGTGFGEYGEGYVRIALVDSENRLKEALKRIKRVLDMED